MIDTGHPAIVERARALGTVERAFAFVRDEIRYDFTPMLTSRDSWRASATLERKKGFCQQKAVLFCALARALGTPAAICFQHIRDHKLLDPRFAKVLPDGIIAFHGLAAVWRGKWDRVDPSLDAGLCRIRGYRLVEWPATGEALLHATDLAGAPHFDFLGAKGPFADFPEGITSLGVELKSTWEALRDVVKKTGATM